MNTALRYAQNEVRKLRRDIDTSDTTTIDLVLVFDRSEEDMKQLVGYSAFAKALAELGGEHTEANIQEACRLTHFSRESVRFNDVPCTFYEDRHIPIKCTKAQALKTMHGKGTYNHSHFSID